MNVNVNEVKSTELPNVKRKKRVINSLYIKSTKIRKKEKIEKEETTQ